MAREADSAEIEIGVYCPPLRKGGNNMSAASILKRKLRGYPVGSLSVRVTGV
jgi:hypothetical protein